MSRRRRHPGEADEGKDCGLGPACPRRSTPRFERLRAANHRAHFDANQNRAREERLDNNANQSSLGLTMKTRISIACQGGGAETAFTAGALEALFEAGIDKDFEIVSLGGTSGGAVCASLIWYALQAGEQPVTKRLMEFWTESNRPQSMQEQMFNQMMVTCSRLVGRGYMPTMEVSPYNPLAKFLFKMATMSHRKTFSDFKEALKEHIDFDRIKEWGPLDKRPILVLGAAGVLSGHLRKFVSRKEVIQVEHILASCCVPNIFPAVEIEGDAYWDGLFADNPPIFALCRPVMVGEGNIPDEIWLIKIEPTSRTRIPTEPDDILDRRKQMEGNVALLNQLGAIYILNDIYEWGGFTPELLKFLQWEHPIRIPKIYADTEDRPYHIPLIEMSPELYEKIDWEAKLDRSAENIDRLMDDGRRRAREFLEARKRVVEAAPRVTPSEKGPRPKTVSTATQF
jgi:NTE family protein